MSEKPFLAVEIYYFSNAGAIDSCEFGPFQLIPYSSKDAARQFINLRNSTKAVGSCFLWSAAAKFPDKVTEAHLLWLNESYIDLTVLNKILLFKVRRNTIALSIFKSCVLI